MSKQIKKESKEDYLDESLVIKNPYTDHSIVRQFRDSRSDYIGCDVCPSVSYLNLQSIQTQQNLTIDLLSSIDKRLNDFQTKTMEAIQTSEEKLENYLILRENHFLNNLKNSDKKWDQKLDYISSDLKNAMTGRFDAIEELINSKIVENVEKCMNALVSIDDSLRRTLLSINSSKSMHTQLSQLKPICELIANNLKQDLRSVVTQCFDDFKKSIIDEKIIEVFRTTTKSKPESESIDDLNESDLWTTSLLKKNETDVETLKSQSLELLSESKIIKSFAIALSLSDPKFVTHLCTVFQNNPQKLTTHLRKSKYSQNLIIDILDQLINDGIVEPNKRWKIPIIGSLIISIDMKSPISKRCVPSLADNWSTIMKSISQMGGQHSESAHLLAISLKHISSQFFDSYK